MTTIAYRDGVIAADGASFRGQTRIDGMVKVARGPEGRLGGACGHAGFMTGWLDWIAGRCSAPPEPKMTQDTADAGLIVYPDGRIELHEADGVFSIATPYYAMGCGRDQALGAMFTGATAEVAIKAAIAHDAYTGGEVTVLAR